MFSWRFRDFWGGIDGYLRDDLTQAEATAQAAWGAQHTSQGAHAAVTATSLTTPRVTLTRASDGAPYTLYVSGGTLYIVAGTSPTGGTVVGTQT